MTSSAKYPSRVTVNVKSVVPVSPSSFTASVAAILSSASSFKIVPTAAATVICALPGGLESVTVNCSSASRSESPVIRIVTVRLVSPGANVTCPAGSVPPKSAALAGFAPLPTTA